jgi:PHD/YefM family antitoxin component YafN of YafNO toxin-antitoxin module
VYLLRRGRRVAALIDAEDLANLIEAAEDLEDLRAANAARAEMDDTGEGPVLWEEVKADLGLA